MAQLENPPDAASPGGNTPGRLRIAAIALRTCFIVVLALIVWRVAMPQNETVWTAYDTPNDLLRMILGLAACVWLAIQLFYGPKEAHGYRTWLYLGLFALPFSVICLVYVWQR